jgi:hypothetical protein
MRSPGSRACSFSACLGPTTTRDQTSARAIAGVCVAFPFCPQGRHPGLFFSKLNTLPADSSCLRFDCGLTTAAARLEVRWFATPFLSDSFIPYCMPVYPGARTDGTFSVYFVWRGPSGARNSVDIPRHVTQRGNAPAIHSDFLKSSPSEAE